MYRCDLCGKTSIPREPALKLVVETRPKTYPPGNDGKLRHGYEIVRELTCHPACALEHKT